MITSRGAVWETAVFLVSLAVFAGLLACKVGTDIQMHAVVIQMAQAGTIKPPADFLYYAVVFVLALFQTDAAHLFFASALALAGAVTAKFMITRSIASASLSGGRTVAVPLDAASPLFSVLMLLSFSLPALNVLRGELFLGQIPSNVWHNSTTVFLMPFALLLFWTSYQQVLQPTKGRLALLALWSVLNVLVKPSYFFVFALAFPVIFAMRHGFGRALLHNLLPVTLGWLIVAALYVLIYRLSFGSLSAEPSGVAVRPFQVWSHHSQSIPVSLAASLAFVGVGAACYWRELVRSLMFQYALLAYVVAVVIFASMSETGPRAYDGNFFWQCVPASYLLFLAVAVVVAQKAFGDGRRTWREKTSVAAFLAHSACGVVYLAKLFGTGSFR